MQVIKLLYVLVQFTHVTIEPVTSRRTPGNLFSKEVEQVDIPDRNVISTQHSLVGRTRI